MTAEHHNAVDELANLVLLVDARPIGTDWADVEGRLGRRLPSDYKDFAKRFGPGYFEGVDLRVSLPEGGTWDDDLSRQTRILNERRAQGYPASPFPVYPEPGGLLPWGFSSDGDTVHWRTVDHDPDCWTVVALQARGSRWSEFGGSMSQFLLALLTREIVVPFLTHGVAEHVGPYIRQDR